MRLCAVCLVTYMRSLLAMYRTAAHHHVVADAHIRQGAELHCDRILTPDDDGRGGSEARNLTCSGAGLCMRV